MNSTRSSSWMKCLLLTLLGTCIFAGLASAQDYEGKFTLPFEARWGSAVLPAGEYTLKLNTGVPPYLTTIRGDKQAVMVLGASVSDRRLSSDSTLIVARQGRKGVVRALYLKETGRVFYYMIPNSHGKLLAERPALLQRIPVVLAGK